jgi:NAD(P)-dependent dehydrogenase (short-subunit alcohol dehydrogenase family)
VAASSKKVALPLAGKVAVITGASRGIGLAIARELAKRGCDLVLTGRALPALKKAGRELGPLGIRTLPTVCDVSDPKAVRALAATVKKQFSRVDILINNAGIAHRSAPVSELPYDEWKAVIETNLTGVFLVTAAILPLMRKGSAIAINLSIAARRSFPGSSAYNASKHGALGLTNTLREELRSKGIRVIALLPGATAPELGTTVWPNAPRNTLLSPVPVAQALVTALLLPADSTVEELTIMPTTGPL